MIVRFTLLLLTGSSAIELDLSKSEEECLDRFIKKRTLENYYKHEIQTWDEARNKSLEKVNEVYAQVLSMINESPEQKVVQSSGDYCYFLMGTMESEIDNTINSCTSQGLALPFENVSIGEIYPQLNKERKTPSKEMLSRMKAVTSLTSLHSERVWIANIVQDGFEGWYNQKNKLGSIMDIKPKKYAYKNPCNPSWVASHFDDSNKKFEPWVRSTGEEKRPFTCIRDTTQEWNFQRKEIIQVPERQRKHFPAFMGNETRVVVHQYCDPPQMTKDRETCLPWKKNWMKVETIRETLRRKHLAVKVNEKCEKDERGTEHCTWDDEIFYDFMRLGWVKDSKNGKAGHCGMIDRPVNECIQARL